MISKNVQNMIPKIKDFFGSQPIRTNKGSEERRVKNEEVKNEEFNSFTNHKVQSSKFKVQSK